MARGIWYISPREEGIYFPPTFHLSPLKSKAKIKTQLKLIGKGICFKGMPGPERKNPERKINVPSSGIQGTRRRRLMGGGRVGARPHTLKLQLHTLVTNNKGAGKKNIRRVQRKNQIATRPNPTNYYFPFGGRTSSSPSSSFREQYFYTEENVFL